MKMFKKFTEELSDWWYYYAQLKLEGAYARTYITLQRFYRANQYGYWSEGEDNYVYQHLLFAVQDHMKRLTLLKEFTYGYKKEFKYFAKIRRALKRLLHADYTELAEAKTGLVKSFATMDMDEETGHLIFTKLGDEGDDDIINYYKAELMFVDQLTVAKLFRKNKGKHSIRIENMWV